MGTGKCISSLTSVHQWDVTTPTTLILSEDRVAPRLPFPSLTRVRDLRMATDDELIEGCRSASPEAWEEVYRRYHRLVRSIATAHGLSGHDAEEVVQITFMVLHSSAQRLRPDSRLAPWLSTVARRHSWRVREKRRREEPSIAAADAASDDDTSEGALRAADNEALRSAFVQLPAQCRCLLEALYFRGEDLSYAEVAAELDLPIGSIGPTRARCLERLRRILTELDSASPRRPSAKGTG